MTPKRSWWQRHRVEPPPAPVPSDLVAEVPLARLDAHAELLRKALEEFEQVRAEAHLKEGEDDRD